MKYFKTLFTISLKYRGAEKSLARPTSRCILFDHHHIIIIGSTAPNGPWPS